MFRIDTLQWAAGGFCAALGGLLLVVPHQFALPAYSALQPHIPWWGVGFVVVGCALLCVVMLAPPRGVVLAVHLAAGAAMIVLAAGYYRGGLWFAIPTQAVLGLSTMLAPLLPGGPRGPAGSDAARERVLAARAAPFDLFALTMGAVAAARVTELHRHA